MKETHAVILFHTTNHALRAEKVLGRAGVTCRLVPVPRQLSSDCGLCVRLAPDAVDVSEGALREAGVETAGTHVVDAS